MVFENQQGISIVNILGFRYAVRRTLVQVVQTGFVSRAISR